MSGGQGLRHAGENKVGGEAKVNGHCKTAAMIKNEFNTRGVLKNFRE